MLQKFLPPPLLRPFIKEYWMLRLGQGSGVPLVMAPVPEQCLYFYPRSQPQPFDATGKPITAFNTMIMGQATIGNTKLLVPDGYCMFKILFQPGGIYRLLNVPMTYFANTYEESAAVLGGEVKQLSEHICNADSDTEVISLTNEYLVRQLSRSKVAALPIDVVLTQTNFRTQTLDQLASAACVSSRQFERQFLERIGVSPKIYQRLLRFNQVMNLRKQNPALKWVDITYHCGYFDPNHLLRDFKQFTGVVPSGFDFENAVIY